MNEETLIQFIEECGDEIDRGACALIAFLKEKGIIDYHYQIFTRGRNPIDKRPYRRLAVYKDGIRQEAQSLRDAFSKGIFKTTDLLTELAPAIDEYDHPTTTNEFYDILYNVVKDKGYEGVFPIREKARLIFHD